MAYVITNQCIGCDRCHSQCPTGAIQHTEQGYAINSSVCNNCVGYYSVPQCAAACPTNNGCIPDIPEYWERWFSKYDRVIARLQNAKQTAYWEQWFEVYSQHITTLIQARIGNLTETIA